jgi:hypothetical protein
MARPCACAWRWWATRKFCLSEKTHVLTPAMSVLFFRRDFVRNPEEREKLRTGCDLARAQFASCRVGKERFRRLRSLRCREGMG